MEKGEKAGERLEILCGKVKLDGVMIENLICSSLTPNLEYGKYLIFAQIKD